jgi:hypothetical protein
MSEATFRLSYDGDAVRDGEMDVADLAPALLGLGQLLRAAAHVVQGEAADVSVRVKTMRDACFEVWLSVAVDDLKSAWQIWKTADVQGAATLLSLLGFSGIGAAVGAIQVVKRLQGNRPKRVTATSPGNVAMEIDGEIIEMPDMVARIALDAVVRAAMERVIADPLEKDGIDSVSLGEAETGPTVAKAEGSYFRALPAADSDEFVSRHTKPFSILTLSFKPGQKWRLNDGASPRQVTMSDADFQARVDASQEAFAKGDLLVCEVVETSRRTATGFRSDYEIVRVKEHRRALADPGLDLP